MTGFRNLMMGAAGAAGAGGYQVDNSAMFNEPDDEYFTRTPSSASNQKTWTFSTWIKRGNLGSDQRIFTATNNGCELFFDANDKLNSYQYTSGSYVWNYISTQLFRDPHAWFHIVVRIDTTQASSGNRVRLYVNGEQITAFDTETAPSQDATGFVNSAVAHYIGRYSGSNSMHYDGYLAETVLIDGSSLAPTSFGETDSNGVWRPIDVSGLTFGTNGFYLNFAASGADLGDDASGNSNDYTNTNSVTQTTDTPTDNHATWSPIVSYNKGVAFSEGNSRSTTSTTAGDVGGLISGFELPTSGKYYWEWVTNTVGTTPLLGWRDITTWSPNSYTSSENNAAKFITGTDYNTGSGRILSSTIDGSTSLSQAAYGNFLTVSGGNPLQNGTVLGCAYDADNGLAWFSYNNTWVDGNGTDNSATVKGEIEAGTSGSQAFTTANGAVGEAGLFITASVQSISSGDFTLRTRSDQWTGTCPTGFTALSTKNQAEAVTFAIEDGSAHHQSSIWEGSSSISVPRLISQSGNSTFQPDWVWGKNRDNSGYSFRYFDSVRGAEKVLQTGGSSYTDAEATDSNGVTDFEANGFDIGNGVHLNGNGESIVAWQWAAGGEPTTDNVAGAGATPTAGSVKIDGSNLGSSLGGTIPVTRLSANRTSGFSIGTYTGSGSNGTIATGLTTKPDMLIIKKRGDDGGNNWVTYHSGLANQGTGYVDLGTNAVEGTLANMFNSVAPGSSDATLFNVGTNTSTNDTGGTDTYVFYCFHEVPGYSKFGTYVGNGNANGPFIEMGFSPSWVMFKRISGSVASWAIYDNKRDSYNAADKMLLPDSTAGDNIGNEIDWLANGVKIKGTSGAYNGSSNNYIYMAFAENPFAGTTPATAR